MNTVETSKEIYKKYLIEYENHTSIVERPWHASIWKFEKKGDKATMITYFWGKTKSQVQSLCCKWIDGQKKEGRLL